MKNIVQCKLCGTDFEYIPGPNGNARQLCNICRNIVDEEELRKLEEESIISGNKYLVDAPHRKDLFDPFSILMCGEFPELKTDADRFVCVMELAKFIKSNGFGGNEDNIINFMLRLDSKPHQILFETSIGILQERLVTRAFERKNKK